LVVVHQFLTETSAGKKKARELLLAPLLLNEESQ
jgi:hypothetical protein